MLIFPSAENIVFSDGLHIDKAIKLARAAKQAGIGCSMGVGTFFTNDFVRNAQPNREEDDGEGNPPASGQETSKPMNMSVFRET